MALSIIRRGGSPVSVRRGDSSIPSGVTSRLDPWNDFAVMDRLLENFFSSPLSAFGRGGTAAQPSFAPTTPSEPVVELYETGEELLAFIYAPGLAPDSFDISATGDSLVLKAERRPLLEVTEGMTSHTPWAGLATGASAWSASYTLPVEIDPNRVEASYKDGVLSLRLPKSEAAKPRRVKVEVGTTVSRDQISTE